MSIAIRSGLEPAGLLIIRHICLCDTPVRKRFETIWRVCIGAKCLDTPQTF